jgi:hypothetical protein
MRIIARACLIGVLGEEPSEKGTMCTEHCTGKKYSHQRRDSKVGPARETSLARQCPRQKRGRSEISGTKGQLGPDE